MTKKIFFVLAFVLGAAPCVYARVESTCDLYVSPSGSDESDGRSPETAKRTIDGAIVCVDRDGMTIGLLAGEYAYPTNTCILTGQRDTPQLEESHVLLPKHPFAVIGLEGRDRTFIRKSLTVGKDDDGNDVLGKGKAMLHGWHDLSSCLVFSGVTFEGLDDAYCGVYAGPLYSAAFNCRFSDCRFTGIREHKVSQKRIPFGDCIFEKCLFDGNEFLVTSGGVNGQGLPNTRVFYGCLLDGCVWRDNAAILRTEGLAAFSYASSILGSLVVDTDRWQMVTCPYFYKQSYEIVVERSTLLFACSPLRYSRIDYDDHVFLADSIIGMGEGLTDETASSLYTTNNFNCRFATYSYLTEAIGEDGLPKPEYDTLSGIGYGSGTVAESDTGETVAQAAGVASAKVVRTLGATVSKALSDHADAALSENISDAATYNAYRTWASTVKGTDGVNVADMSEVKASAYAWAAFALGSERLLSDEPKIEIVLESVDGSTGKKSMANPRVMTVAVKVVDGGDVVNVSSEKVADMFEATSDLGDWNGDAKLGLSVTSLGVDDEGMMRYAVTPGDGSSRSAFLRLKVK